MDDVGQSRVKLVIIILDTARKGIIWLLLPSPTLTKDKAGAKHSDYHIMTFNLLITLELLD